jgi:hypothetical protein
MDTKHETYDITNSEDHRYLRCGKQELAFILNDERFLTHRDCSNKFKKHLGFTLEFVKVPNPESGHYTYQHRVVIHDKQKLMLFKVKYGL